MKNLQTRLEKYLAKNPNSIRVFVNDDFLKIKKLFDAWKTYSLEHQNDKNSKIVIATRRQLFDDMMDYARTDYFNPSSKITIGFFFSTQLELAIFVSGKNEWLEGSLGVDIEDFAIGCRLSENALTDILSLRQFGLTCSINAIRARKDCTSDFRTSLNEYRAKLLEQLDRKPWEDDLPEPNFSKDKIELLVIEHPDGIASTDYCKAFSQDFEMEQDRVMISTNSNQITLLPSDKPYILNTCGLDTLVCPYNESYVLEVEKRKADTEFEFIVKQIQK